MEVTAACCPERETETQPGRVLWDMSMLCLTWRSGRGTMPHSWGCHHGDVQAEGPREVFGIWWELPSKTEFLLYF